MSIFDFDITPRYIAIPASRRWCRIVWGGVGLLVGYAAGVWL